MFYIAAAEAFLIYVLIMLLLAECYCECHWTIVAFVFASHFFTYSLAWVLTITHGGALHFHSSWTDL